MEKKSIIVFEIRVKYLEGEVFYISSYISGLSPGKSRLLASTGDTEQYSLKYSL